MARVLIVDDDAEALRQAVAIASGLGHAVLSAASGDAALNLLLADPLIDAMLLDMVMPDRDGFAVFDALARNKRHLPVIAMTTPDAAPAARRAGAVDFIEKPVLPARFDIALANALRFSDLESLLRRHTTDADDFIGIGPATARSKASLLKFARSELPLLIEGEAGTGREHFARLVHATGSRHGRPFIICDGAPADLQVSLQQAKGGTLFIREIGRLAPETQRALLGFIENGTLRLPGTARPVRLDVRLIASSTVRLVEAAGAVAAGLTRSAAWAVVAEIPASSSAAMREVRIVNTCISLRGLYNLARHI